MRTSFSGKTSTAFVHALVGCALSAAPLVNAAIIHNQSGATLPGINVTLPDGSGDGRGLADDFVFATDQTLTRIEWTGGLFSSLGAISTPPTELLSVSIREDLGGQPEGDFILNLTPPTTITNISTTPGAIINRYAVDVAPILLLQGRRYWLGVIGVLSGTIDPPDVAWHWSTSLDGNGEARAFVIGPTGWATIDEDFSFTLIGPDTPVPLPSTAALALLGIAALGYTRRK